MKRFQTSIEIRAPAEEVWQVLSGIERWPEWAPTFTRITRGGTVGEAPGAVYYVDQPRLPTARMTIDEWLPGRGFTWSATRPFLRAVALHSIEAVDPRTCRVDLEFRFEGLLAPLAGMTMGNLVKRYVATEARALKARVEGADDRN